jgi:hypothetical protein
LSAAIAWPGPLWTLAVPISQRKTRSVVAGRTREEFDPILLAIATGLQHTLLLQYQALFISEKISDFANVAFSFLFDKIVQS